MHTVQETVSSPSTNQWLIRQCRTLRKPNSQIAFRRSLLLASIALLSTYADWWPRSKGVVNQAHDLAFRTIIGSRT